MTSVINPIWQLLTSTWVSIKPPQAGQSQHSPVTRRPSRSKNSLAAENPKVRHFQDSGSPRSTHCLAGCKEQPAGGSEALASDQNRHQDPRAVGRRESRGTRLSEPSGHLLP